jgi:hypothetical protein
VIWRGVLVPGTAVGGDGFTAAAGATTRFAIELACRSWEYTEQPFPPRRMPDGSYELAGEPLPAHSEWLIGWVLSLGDLCLYVTDAGPPPGRPAPDSGPRPGSLVRARGDLTLAEDYVTDAFRPRDVLTARTVRRWRVHRIVALSHTGAATAVTATSRRAAAAYLLDVADTA